MAGNTADIIAFPINPKLANANPYVAIFCRYFSLKHTRANTKDNGISKNTIANIENIRDIPMIIRTPLIEGVTATKENLRSIASLLCGKENLIYYQLLNFNPLGASKYQSLDKKNVFAEAKPYSDAQMKEFGEMLSDMNIKIKVGE